MGEHGIAGRHGAAVRPFELLLRGYVRPQRGKTGLWEAHCIDLDIFAVGPTPEAAESSLWDAVNGYLDTVFQTSDVHSVPRLLLRRAPLSSILTYHAIAFFSRFRNSGSGGPHDLTLTPTLRLA